MVVVVAEVAQQLQADLAVVTEEAGLATELAVAVEVHALRQLARLAMVVLAHRES
jgi:hypothetical protein